MDNAGFCLGGYALYRGQPCSECGARDDEKCKRWDYDSMTAVHTQPTTPSPQKDE